MQQARKYYIELSTDYGDRFATLANSSHLFDECGLFPKLDALASPGLLFPPPLDLGLCPPLSSVIRGLYAFSDRRGL